MSVEEEINVLIIFRRETLADLKSILRVHYTASEGLMQ